MTDRLSCQILSENRVLMKKRIIIDGYNLIYQIPDLRRLIERDLESARNMMVQQLAAFADKQETEVIVVFDGDANIDKPYPPHPRLRVSYSRFPERADPLIMKMIQATEPGIDLYVVSSDKEIMACVKEHHYHTLTSQKFASDLQPKTLREAEKKFDHSMSDSELNEWIKLFRDKSSQNDSKEK